MKCVDFSEKSHDELCLGMMKDIIRCTDLLDAPLTHDHNLIRNLKGFILIMSHEYAGDSKIIVQATQPSPQLFAYLRIECSEWLIKQQNLRLDRQCSCECNSLALPAGELMRIPCRQPIKLNETEKFMHTVADVFL